MTISSESYKSGPYSGNDSTTVFSYGFKIYANTEIEVIKTASDGSESTLVLSTDYTVSGVGNDSGGDVTYPVTGSPLATGEKLTIRRVNPLTQLTDLRNQGTFFSENIEKAMDRLIMVVQQQQEKIDRMLRLPSSTTSSDLVIPDPESGKYLQWRADLTGLQNVTAFLAGAVTVSSFAETLVDDPDASTMLSTLGFGSQAKNLIGNMETDEGEWPYSYTPTFLSATSFKVPTDLTDEFHENRRVKTQNTGGVIYSTITSSSYSSPDTTVTVRNDSGVLDSGLSSVELPFLRGDNLSTPEGQIYLLESKVASASSSLDFTSNIDSRFSAYMLRFFNIVPSATVQLYLRFSDDTGSTWKSGASDYSYFGTSRGTSAGGASNSFVGLTIPAPGVSSTASHGGASGEVVIYNPSNASIQTNCIGNVGFPNTSSDIYEYGFSGSYLTASSIDGFRIIPASGNITSGTVKLYGIK